jgi:hypothetical protein
LCRFFWYVGIEDVNRSIPYDASTIPGTRKIHSVKTKCFQNGFAFDRRNDSCFCSVCIEDTESIDICENENAGYVKAWRHTELNVKGKMPLASSEEMESNETIVSVDGDRVSDLVREGKIFMFKFFQITCRYILV